MYSSVHSQEHDWRAVLSSNGIGNESILQVMRDNQGNFIIQGIYQDPSFEFAGNKIDGIFTKPSNGNPRDVFLAKFNKNYELVWMRSMEGVDSVASLYANHADVDNSGNIYMALEVTGGSSECAMIFGNDTFRIEQSAQYWFRNCFLVKYSPEGEVLWARKFPSTVGSSGAYCHKDNGVIFHIAMGNNMGPIAIDNDTFTNPYPGTTHVLMASFDSSGRLDHANMIGGKYTDLLGDIDVDYNGNVYVTGFFSSDTCYFGDQYILNSKGGHPFFNGEGFYAKYDKSGTLIWVKHIPQNISLKGNIHKPEGGENPAGDYYLAAVNEGTVSSDAVPIFWMGDTVSKGGFYAKIDNSGNPSSINLFTDSLWFSGHRVIDFTNDESGNMFILNSYVSDSVSVAGQILKNITPNRRDFFAVMIDPDLNPTLYFYGGGDDQEDVVMAAWGDKNIALAGGFKSGTFKLDTIELTNGDFPTYDAFMAFYTKEEGNVSTRKLKSAPKYLVFPNPVGEELKLQGIAELENVRVTMLDLQGNEIAGVDIGSGSETCIQVSHLLSGIYFLKINSDRGTHVIRFIKK